MAGIGISAKDKGVGVELFLILVFLSCCCIRFLSVSLCFSFLSGAADCCSGSWSYRPVWEPQTMVDVAAVSGRGVDGKFFLIVVFFVCHTTALMFCL